MGVALTAPSSPENTAHCARRLSSELSARLPLPIVHVNHDLVNECTHDALAQAGIRIRPECFKLARQVEKIFAARNGDPLFVLHVLLKLLLHGLYVLQSLVPSTFKLTGDQTVLRIRSIKLLLSPARRVLGSFQIPLQGCDNAV